MNGISVPIVIIDESRRDQYLETGYNSPEGGYDEEAFLAECRAVNDKVRAAVEKHWKHWSIEGIRITADKESTEADLKSKLPKLTHVGDFFMHEDLGLSRFLCIEVSRETILTPTLLKVVHDVISGIDPDYSVDICDAFSVLKTKDGTFYPRFNIFVEKDRILVYSESRDLFKKIGIPYLPSKDYNGEER